MLCERLFRVLLEESVMTKAKAMDAIEGAAELTREMENGGNPALAGSDATAVEAIANSFAS